jgi:hypothetical protein
VKKYGGFAYNTRFQAGPCHRGVPSCVIFYISYQTEKQLRRKKLNDYIKKGRNEITT